MKLGLAGGPLVVAILISAYGHKFHLVTYTNSSANLLLREIGICLFLASVGIAAGKDFAATVFNMKGALWVGYGFLITVIPLIIVGCIARGKYKMNYLTIIGMMSGNYTDPRHSPMATRWRTTMPPRWLTPLSILSLCSCV